MTHARALSIALLSVLGPSLIQLALMRYFRLAPFMLFFLGAAATGWWGTGWSVVLFVVLSALVSNYAFMPPNFQLHLAPDGLIATGAYALVALLFAGAFLALRARDLERTRLLAQLRSALVMRDEFLSVASHELRTPLTSLLMSVEGLHRAPSDPKRLDRVRRAADRLVELVDRMFDVSVLSSGRLVLAPESVDLAQLARDVATRFADQAERTSCPIELVISEPVIGCWDRSRLDQVLSNLLANALKYGDHKPVRIEIGRQGNEAWVRVSDQGIGIAPEQLERIFDRFERAVSVRRYAGLGLGLWVAREIVRASGGRIEASSTLGGGSTFSVYLPLPEPSAEAVSMPVSVPLPESR